MTSPKGWPPHLPYLTSPSHSRLLTRDQLSALKTNSPDLPLIPPSATQTPYPSIKITPIADPSHPANGQAGLFATRALRPAAFVLLYLGSAQPGADAAASAEPPSDYELWLDRDAGVAVDAGRSGNEARFVNDYRGVRERPNAEFREAWSARHQERCMAVFVLPEGKRKGARKAGAAGIAKGEEVLVSYGKGFWGHRLPDGVAGPDAEREPDVPEGA